MAKVADYASELRDAVVDGELDRFLGKLLALAVVSTGFVVWTIFVMAPWLGWPIAAGLAGFSFLVAVAGLFLFGDNLL